VDALVTTREALHAVAEWVLAPAVEAATGRIGLRVTPGGFGTPELPGRARVRVDGTELVVGDRRQPLTTLAEAAFAAGVEPGQASPAYETVTRWDPDRPLAVDPQAVQHVTDWFAFGAEVLEVVRSSSVDPSPIQLWPEHFDVAFDAGGDGHRANFGASPGDAEHPQPYLYVGPWQPIDRAVPFWNETFGAALGWDALATVPDRRAAALAFLLAGRDLAGRS
jgi:hypothetical protein